MAKSIGVYQKNGYWYSRINGKERYFGAGEKGMNKAIAAKHGFGDNSDEKRSRPQFRTVGELVDWYMERPTVAEKKYFVRVKTASKPLRAYFKDTPVFRVDTDEQMKYQRDLSSFANRIRGRSSKTGSTG